MIESLRVEQSIGALPTLSTSVAQLAALLKDPDSGVQDFERVIRMDPALTVNLLRLVNSPYFGSGREVGTVRSAVMLLGQKRTFELAASAAFASVIPAELLGYEIRSLGFWRHCVAVAILAEELAKDLLGHEPDLIFTAALLHDVGKLAASGFVAEQQQEVLAQVEDGGASLVEAERRVLQTDHANLGGLVAQHWELPNPIVQACRWHHQPSLSPPDVDRELVDLVHVADGLAHLLGFGADIGQLARKIDPEVVQRLNLTTEHLEVVAGRSIDEIHETCQAFVEGG